jgi:hypothetical protein
LITIRSEGALDFGADLLACGDVLEDDFFEAGEVLVALRDKRRATSLRRLLNPYEVSSMGTN